MIPDNKALLSIDSCTIVHSLLDLDLKGGEPKDTHTLIRLTATLTINGIVCLFVVCLLVRHQQVNSSWWSVEGHQSEGKCLSVCSSFERASAPHYAFALYTEHQSVFSARFLWVNWEYTNKKRQVDHLPEQLLESAEPAIHFEANETVATVVSIVMLVNCLSSRTSEKMDWNE